MTPCKVELLCPRGYWPCLGTSCVITSGERGEVTLGGGQGAARRPTRTGDAHSKELQLFSRWVMPDSFAAPQTVACQVPLSMGFPRENTGMGCHFLLQGIFPNQGSNSRLLHWQADSLPVDYHGSLQQGINWPQTPTVLQLRNSGAEILKCHQTGS